MINFIIIASFFVSIFIIVEIISRKFHINREVSRKTAHIIVGIGAAFLPLIISFDQIMLLAVFSAVMMIFSRFFKLFQSVHNVKRHSFGELFFPMGIFLTAWLFPELHAYQFGILIMAVSDGLAGLIGSSFGKKKYRFGQGQKSYIGSIVFFISAVIIGYFFCQSFIVIIFAIILTFVEAMSDKGADNLLLPVIGAMLLLTVTV